MVWVVEAKVIGNYEIRVEFNDGVNGIINFEKIIREDHRDIIKELIDIKKFKTVKVENDTLSWENGVDFAPEYLYEKIKMQKSVA
jgi:hypothetical protein